MLIPNVGFIVMLAAGIGVLAAIVGLSLWAVVRRPAEEVRATGVPRAVWLVLTVAFDPAGTAAFFVAVRLSRRAEPGVS